MVLADETQIANYISNLDRNHKSVLLLGRLRILFDSITVKMMQIQNGQVT